MKIEDNNRASAHIYSVHEYGELEAIGPVNLHCAVEGGEPTNFELQLLILPPAARYTAMFLGVPKEVGGDGPLVRISSACIWAHLFGSQHCDCGIQLEMAKAAIAKERAGLIIYCHDHHGKGVGLKNHFLVYAEGQRLGRELVVEAYEQLGFREDYRSYGDVVTILRHFGISRCRLLTNSPGRVAALAEGGIRVVREAICAGETAFNAPELFAKRQRLGHLIAASSGEGLEKT